MKVSFCLYPNFRFVVAQMAGPANLHPVDNNITNSKLRSWRKPTAAPLRAFNQGVNLAGLTAYAMLHFTGISFCLQCVIYTRCCVYLHQTRIFLKITCCFRAAYNRLVSTTFQFEYRGNIWRVGWVVWRCCQMQMVSIEIFCLDWLWHRLKVTASWREERKSLRQSRVSCLVLVC